MGVKYDNLQVLRGLSCLLVVAFHVANSETDLPIAKASFAAFRWFGYAGVDVFFVISGFIIAATNRPELRCPARLPGYVFRRLWRVYPPYWAALVVAVLAYVCHDTEPLVRSGWRGELF